MKESTCWALEFIDWTVRLAFVESAGKILFIISEVVADKKIEITIVVIVKEGRACAPQFIVDSGALSVICKSAVAVVAVELAGAVAGDVNIRPAVVVIVSDRQTHAQYAVRDARALCHVGKGAIMIVYIKKIIRIKIIGNIDIFPAIPVKISNWNTMSVPFNSNTCLFAYIGKYRMF